MAPFIAGIVTSLIQNNLGKVAQAVVDKGLDVVEDKLGVKLEPEMSAEKVAEIQAAAMKHDEFKIQAVQEAVIAEGKELSARHNADMNSDSWLSKNIRPMTLIAIFIAYFGFAIASVFNYNANENYVALLGEWGMLIMSFYFGGRTVEKVMQMVSAKKGE